MKSHKTYLAAGAGAVLATGALAVTGAYAAPAYLIDSLNLTEEQVAIMDEAHELREAGDRAGAHELMQSLGIDREAFRAAHHEHKEAVHEAIEAGDYEAFLAATEGSPRGDFTLEQFEVLVEAHELKAQGEHEAADELLEEAGLDMKHHQHRHGAHKETE